MSPSAPAWLRRAAGALLLACAAPAAAQTPDSTAVQPDTTARAEPARDDPASPDTARAEPRAVPLAAPQPDPWGRTVAPAFALTGELTPEALLELPEAFGYALGTPGRSGGVALWGLPPEAASLELDGRALDDLYTGAPRLDLLPAEALGPLRLGGASGAPVRLSGEVRPFRLGRPITELRLQTGQESVQHASATHAQTRRAPAAAQRLVGAPARTTLTAHAATRGATGPTAGGQTRHSHALVRVVAAGPTRALELGGLYADHLDGARRGLTGPDLATLFEPRAATPLDGSATRRTLRTELWATARAPLLGAEPLALTLRTVGQRLRYSPDGVDTLQASVNRVALQAAQAGRWGPHQLAARATLSLDGDPSGGTDLFGDGGARRGASLAVLDSLALGAWTATVVPGAHLVGARAWPSLGLGLERGALRLGARLGARAPSRLAERGLAGRIAADPDGALERTARADARLAVSAGALDAELQAWGARTTAPQRLVALGDTSFGVVRLPDLTSAGGALGVGWRRRALSGLYATASVTAHRTLGAEGLAQRDADALPALWGRARLGVRSRDINDVLDLDLGLRLAGWTAFRSRLVEPTTGALALPDPTSAALGRELPARGTLGLDLTARFADRATVFVRYDNALASRLYDGALVTQGEPLTATALRFGVFWVLLD